MKQGFCSSSESKPCVVCNKQTANYRTYEQANIEIKIPLCDNVYENKYCWRSVDVKKLVRQQLIDLKREILKQAEEGDNQ
ncbi:hypothetical protein H70357_24650 [Paenibacillus sp. FSL H7-0357]|uniref:hypothetical protein n=1 Tax=Paenibacillus sp. FSL H7-0357 TaxID=1536774 RepID=UPI0004F6B848|nr:hypothetical protein [Paenibacillus sp. FSL H7-0357]AIQ19546.1 hypothetical protein H70357_24650 [Paenibacillus sp. FSL H7-0357]